MERNQQASYGVVPFARNGVPETVTQTYRTDFFVERAENDSSNKRYLQFQPNVMTILQLDQQSTEIG